MAAISLGPDLGIMLVTHDKAPELKTMFVVSSLLLRRLPEGARPRPAPRETVTVFGFDVEVEVHEFPDPTEAAAAWARLVKAFKGLGLAVVAASAEGEELHVPALVLKDPSVEERYLGDDGDKDGMRASFRSTIRFDCEVVGRFSRITGIVFRYCVGRYLTQPPLPYEQGAINIHMGMRPPGYHRNFSVKVREVFGCKIWSDGEERCVHGPVAWRGHLISSDGIPVCQVLGNNYYQMVLMHADANNGFERCKIWERMLALMARDFSAPPPVPQAEATPEDVEAGVRGMVDRRTDEIKDALRKLEFELGDMQQKFTQKLRERDEQVSLLATLRRETADAAERCGEDLTRLRAMEDVTSVRIDAEDGLLVETAPIALERDGRRYELGSFRIHLAADGAIAVWTETPRHPKGHHHPHIDRSALECFGNVTLAVAKQASGYRFADAVTLILRWLRSYRPETTLIPLEEFPSTPIPKTKGAPHEEVRTQKARRKGADRAEPLAAAQAVRSEGRKAGHADRGRSDRKPRRRGAGQDRRA